VERIMTFGVSRNCHLLVLAAVVSLATAVSAGAQQCLAIDACLLSPTRTDAGRQIVPNGCSVPPEAGQLGQFWGAVFTQACNQHDIDWGTFKSDIAAWFTQSNLAFRTNMLAICQTRTDLSPPVCAEAANLFFLGVSTTSIGQDIYRQSQYLSSSCACVTGPAPPTNLTAQVSPGGVVNLQWTASPGATSYQLDLLQPPLGSLNTNTSAPGFSATGVPNGVYRLQVRAVNPSGVSAPSNVLDVVVGAAAPCAPPTAPAAVSATLVNGTATVSFNPSPGATSYLLSAGSAPGGSDLFNANIGNTTVASASGLPAGFRAFARVQAVNACGTSSPSTEVFVGPS
jgi:hypothetical protein